MSEVPVESLTGMRLRGSISPGTSLSEYGAHKTVKARFQPWLLGMVLRLFHVRSKISQLFPLRCKVFRVRSAGNRGAESLAGMLTHCENVAWLSLAWNHIGPSGKHLLTKVAPATGVARA